MNEELDALIKKALSEEPTDKKEEKKSVLTDEERELAYKDDEGDFKEPWQKIYQK